VITIPARSSPWRQQALAAANPATATTAARTSQARAGACAGSNARSTMPRSDWLPAEALPPRRLLSKTALVQYTDESCGAIRKVRPVQPAKDSAATPAARRRPVISRYTMKTPGTSLIAVARPTSSPRGQRGWRVPQSSRHNATRKMST
jgi:hypothetical protein